MRQRSHRIHRNLGSRPGHVVAAFATSFVILFAPFVTRAATGLSCGSTVFGDITEVGTAAGSEVEFEYPVAAGGHVITLDARTVSTVDPGFVPCWQLISPTGVLLGARICGGDQKRTLPEAGTYRVSVRDQNRDHRGGFAITLQGIDGAGSCGTPLTCDGEDTFGPITAPSGSMAFRLTGTAGERVSLSVAAAADSDPALVPCGELYSPSGVLVGARECGRLERLLHDSGTFTLLVTAEDHATTGTVHASFQGLAAGSVCGPRLSCGDSPAGALSFPGDTDAFRFHADIDDAFAIHLGTTLQSDPGFEGCLDVWSPTGKHPVNPTCGPVTLRAAEAGDYTAQVFAKNSSARGDYRISFQAGTASTQCGVPLTCGSSSIQLLESIGDSDAFSIAAQPGSVAIQVRAETIGANPIIPKWWLFTPTGVRSQIGRSGLAVVTFPVAGVYTLVVADADDDGTGAYVAGIEGLSDATRCGPMIGCSGAGVPGRLDDRADVDAFGFGVVQGDQVTIDVVVRGTNSTSNFKPCWSIYDPSGAAILENQCTARQATFGISGTYTVMVYEDGGDAIGDYQLNLTGTCPVAPDGDLDGVADSVDNCPTRVNPNQEDNGGLGVNSLPDGLGDACQCGDVTGDGRVTISDATAVTRSMLVPPAAILARPENCDSNGSFTCSVADSVVVRRSLLVPPTATIVPSCAESPAQP